MTIHIKSTIADIFSDPGYEGLDPTQGKNKFSTK